VLFGVGGRNSCNKRHAASAGDDSYFPADDGLLLPSKRRRRSDSTAEPAQRRSDDESDEDKRAHYDDLETDESEDHDIDVVPQQQVQQVAARLAPREEVDLKVQVEGGEADQAMPCVRPYNQGEGDVLCFTTMPTEVQVPFQELAFSVLFEDSLSPTLSSASSRC
jgi:hypothetical protein